ncbi:MAG TPA: SAM-dependent methyltransferase, partial [Propylenella sp.]|nr:SAM-dependent methyltransferase [Propylenella sp.]
MTKSVPSAATEEAAVGIGLPSISFRGHAAIQATDHRQIEILLSDGWANRPAAIGLGARFEPQALTRLRGRVVVIIECGDESDRFETTLSAEGVTGNAIVFRRDPALHARTFGFDSSKAAADLSAGLKERLRQPDACALIHFQPVGEDLQRSAGLFIVGMPIGNQADLSPRALAVLGSVDVIFAEDTRVAREALTWRGIRTPIRSCHAHNEAARADELASRLLEGQRIALISDAGMPLISDPGARLVDAAVAASATVTVVPGPSAIMAALVLSGLPAASFR